MPTVLSIGTTHPHNIAGVGRDLIVGAEFDCNVVTAIAAVTAQDEHTLQAMHVLPARVLSAQLHALEGTRPDAIRVGALGSAENVRLVAEYLSARASTTAVVDPVLRASTGGALIDDEGFFTLRDRLAPLPNVVMTPNLTEAAVFLGHPVIERSTMDAAARQLREHGGAAVLLKGGHLDGDPLDVLATGDGVELFEASRIAGAMRGTGCTLAMAMACELALGRNLRDAVIAAREYLREKMTANIRGE